MQLNTLKKNKEFNLTYAKGRSYPAKNVVLIVLKRKYGGVRIGFAVSKKIGNAVVRNRIRRRLKEAARNAFTDVSGNYYFILIARKSILDAEFSAICLELDELVRRAKLKQAMK